MDESLIFYLIIGALAGWASGLVMQGKGFGLLGNILVGIIGGFIGGKLFDLLNISTGGGIIGSFITAAVGAIVLLWIARKLK